MQPLLELLSPDLVARILDEAFQLMVKPGIKVKSTEGLQLLAAAGADVDEEKQVALIPEGVVRQALDSVPSLFQLYDRAGEPTVTYGGGIVQFDPGSSGVHILDADTLEHRPAQTADLLRLVKVAEMLPQFAAQSTAVVCNEVPKEISDSYRLYLLLLHTSKPIVTGAFSLRGLANMLDLLGLFPGGRGALAERPRAVFDVCPSPPLIWSEFAAGNLIELARARVPAEIVSMPLAGVAAPVTLLGAVTQHAAECLSGIAIHQLASPGAPIVWGGAPAIFDMRRGTTPMGAIETAMIDVAYAQVGKCLNLPTHTYLCATDSKLVDAQSGMESGMSALLGALAGINMISGAGMIDFLACQSPEKLVLDAEAIAAVSRLLQGLEVRTPTLATGLFEGINFKGDFLKQRLTRELFPMEQHLPSSVIDRDSIRGWQENGSLDAFGRAKAQVRELLARYEPPPIDSALVAELHNTMGALAASAGMETLPVTA
jgi:trimethylamine--corrinoid protein Co-methyltransferase